MSRELLSFIANQADMSDMTRGDRITVGTLGLPGVVCNDRALTILGLLAILHLCKTVEVVVLLVISVSIQELWLALYLGYFVRSSLVWNATGEVGDGFLHEFLEGDWNEVLTVSLLIALSSYLYSPSGKILSR